MITAFYDVTYVKKIKTKRTHKRKYFVSMVASRSVLDLFGINVAKRLEQYVREELHGTMVEYHKALTLMQTIGLNLTRKNFNKKQGK